MLKRDLIQAVIEHAVDHYECQGWDTLVESWDDEEIWSVIEGAASEKEAIRIAAQALKPINDYRMEIINA